ncbi:lipase family protein [Streptacidiphilus sp. PAMC 29251]
MALVMAVHGVGKQALGEESLLKDWVPALADGLHRAGGPALGPGEVAMGFYGDLFRPAGQLLAVGDPLLTAADVQEGFEQDLLFAWWQEAARVDPAVVAPGADTLARTPRSVQAALRALAGSRFFSDIALRSLVFDLKQVRRYLEEPVLRIEARERVKALIGPQTRVVVGHSLGSVVAYEALCSLPGHGVRALVTLGSPLGIPMVFDRLLPPDGPWPASPANGGSELVWTNVSDLGDVVALVKDLRPLFGAQMTCATVDNGAHAHDATSYLTDKLTGTAIRAALDGR